LQLGNVDKSVRLDILTDLVPGGLVDDVVGGEGLLHRFT